MTLQRSSCSRHLFNKVAIRAHRSKRCTQLKLLSGYPDIKYLQSRSVIRSDVLSHLSQFSTWTVIVKVAAKIKTLRSKLEYLIDLTTIQEHRRDADMVIMLVQQAFKKILQRREVLFFTLTQFWTGTFFVLVEGWKGWPSSHQIKVIETKQIAYIKYSLEVRYRPVS